MDIDWETMNKTLQVGDWKLLYILSKNMESMAYEEFLYEFSKLHTTGLSVNSKDEKKEEKKQLFTAWNIIDESTCHVILLIN